MNTILHPYSDTTKFASGGIWEPTLANFPCLRNWWKAEEAQGAATLVDAIAGNNLTATISRTGDGFGVDFTSTISRLSGTMGTISTPFLFMAVGKFPTGTGLFLQDQTTGASMNLQTLGGAVSVAGTPLPSPLTVFTADTTTRGRALIVSAFSSATGFSQVEVDTSATKTATLDKDISGASAVTSIPMTTANDTLFSYPANATALYGAAIFTFAAIPGNWQSAVAWMTNEWAAGRKVIYPGWKGVS